MSGPAIHVPDRARSTLTLVFPEPPSANRYWRTRVARTRLGKVYVQTYKSPEARAYQEGVATRARLAGLQPVAGDVQLTVRWYRRRRTGDASNRLKILEDALIGIAFADDKQVRRAVIERFEDAQNPRVEVEIEAAP